ncbi:MAG: hypothetical protein K8S87_01765 [Planctomycetes bacterium]|nr:hypothetical protein [Planctomycetota bacterium]
MRIYPTKRQLKYLEEIGVFLTESDRKHATQRKLLEASEESRRKKSFGELTAEFIRTHIKQRNIFWVLLQILLFIVVVAALA